MGMLYLIRGLPGAGKSTFAKELAEALNCKHLEADQYLYTEEGEYLWTPKRLGWAIRNLNRDVELEMQTGADVVVAGVFATNKSMSTYKKLAVTYGYDVTYVVVENRRDGKNIHDVPHETLEHMREAFTVKL